MLRFIKLIRFFAKILSVLLFLLSACYGILQTSWAQTKLIAIISKQLESTTQLKVSIDKVDFEFFKTLVLDSIHIQTHAGETVLIAEQLKSSFDLSEIQSNNYYFSSIELHKPEIRIVTDTAGVSSIDNIINLFNAPKDSLKFGFRIDQLSIIDGIISNRDYRYDSVQDRFSQRDCEFKAVHLYLSEISKRDSLISCNIENASFHEKSGFKLENFSSHLYATNQSLAFKRLYIVVNNSTFSGKYLDLEFDSFKDFSEFDTKVRFRSKFDRSFFKISDLSYFLPRLKEAYNSYDFSGQLRGTLDNLKAKRLQVFLTDSTYFKGSFSINGLKDYKTAFIDANVDECKFNYSDIFLIQKPPFDTLDFFTPPIHLKRLGDISYNGRFTGFVNDFVAYGDFDTDLGEINTDVRMRPDSISDHFLISGKVEALDFHLGHLTRRSGVGKISLTGNLNGVYSEKKLSKGTIVGTIHEIELFGYNYQNAQVNGHISEKFFQGSVVINEPNLKMNFNGTSDFGAKTPIFKFDANVEYANLHKLNVAKHDSTSFCNFKLNADFEGRKIDDIIGNIKLTELHFKNQELDINKDSLVLMMERDGKQKNYTIESDAFRFNVKGDVELSKLKYSLNRFSKKFVPAIYKDLIDVKDTLGVVNVFNYSFELRKTDNIFTFFLPNIEIADGAFVFGKYTDIDTAFTAFANASYFKINERQFDDALIECKTEQDSFFAEINVAPDIMGNRIKKLNSKIKSANNQFFFDTKWRSVDSLAFNGNINISVGIDKDKEERYIFNGQVLPSHFSIKDDNWEISQSDFWFNNQRLSIDSLFINSESQNLQISGGIDRIEKDTLDIKISDFNLAPFSTILIGKKEYIKATINGNVQITDLFRNFEVNSHLDLDSCAINNISLGDIQVNSSWDKSNQILLYSLSPQSEIKKLYAQGSYLPQTKKIDARLDLNGFDISFLSHLFDKYARNIHGTVDGKVFISGSPDNLLYSGKLNLYAGKFKINYLNTEYQTSGPVQLKNGNFLFNNLNVYDQYGSKAKLNGRLRYGGRNIFNYKLDIDFDDYFVFNTTEAHNKLFYGKAFANGTVILEGDKTHTDYRIVGTTEKNTEVYIPISEYTTTGESAFLSFKSKSPIQAPSIEKEKKQLIKTYDMDLSLDVTPEAQVILIFEELMGDMIKARGRGNMRMKLDRNNKYSLNSEFVIDQGEYQFTLSGLINKKFHITPGSRIEWTGDPYDANIDIDAVYKLRTNLSPLMMLVSDSATSYNKRVNVECHIVLKNSLQQPDIDFYIEVPNSGERPKEVLQMLSDEDLNKQFISLLIFHSFLNDNSNGLMSVNSTEVLTNQLSNWLSQISNNVDVGINVRRDNEIGNNEVDVGLSTQFFSDRVVVEVNGTSQLGETDAFGEKNSQIAGDASIEIKVTPNGKLRFKGFTRTNTDPLKNANGTQGAALYYTEEFNSFKDLFKKKKKEEEKTETDTVKQKATRVEELEEVIEEETMN